MSKGKSPRAVRRAEARAITRRLLGEQWSGVYRADDPDGEWHLYPLGELAHVEDRLP